MPSRFPKLNRPLPVTWLEPDEDPFDVTAVREIVDLRMDAGFYRMAKAAFSRYLKSPPGQVDRLMAAAECIIFSAMTIEAFVNWQYEHCKFEPTAKALLGVTLRKLSLEQKWEQLPILLGGRAFDKGTEPWRSLKDLIHTRNDLVHFSGSAWRIVDGKPSKHDSAKLDDYATVSRLFETVERMIDELGNLVGPPPQKDLPAMLTGLRAGEKVDRFLELSSRGVLRFIRSELSVINPNLAACHFCSEPLNCSPTWLVSEPDPRRYLICPDCFFNMYPDADRSLTTA